MAKLVWPRQAIVYEKECKWMGDATMDRASVAVQKQQQ